ncbi:hypothetical protein MJO28_014942, partial [Puccinia striiformis f. sp. tritici]
MLNTTNSNSEEIAHNSTSNIAKANQDLNPEGTAHHPTLNTTKANRSPVEPSNGYKVTSIIPAPPPNSLTSRDKFYKSIQDWGLKHGFVIATKSSYLVKGQRLVVYQCKKSGHYPAHRPGRTVQDFKAESQDNPTLNNDQKAQITKLDKAGYARLSVVAPLVKALKTTGFTYKLRSATGDDGAAHLDTPLLGESQYKKFHEAWNYLLSSTSPKSYQKNMIHLAAECSDEGTKYITKNWILIKDWFVWYLITGFLHFGNINTSQVESLHASVRTINNMQEALKHQLHELTIDSPTQKTVYMNSLPTILSKLNRKILHSALRASQCEYLSGSSQATECNNCTYESHMGMPCSHKMWRVEA